MVHFYGTIQGHRGIASRCGSTNSGMVAMVKSWTNTPEMRLFETDGEDDLRISFPENMKTTINGRDYKTTEDNIANLMDFKEKIENGEIETDEDIKKFAEERW